MPSKIWTPLDLNLRPVEIDQIEKIIRKSLIGQDRAVKQGLRIFNRMFSGIRPYDDRGHRPLGTFVFLGPTGVGKTLLAEEIARVVTGSPNGQTIINCAEFQKDDEIAKLIGAPPGYIGWNRDGDRWSSDTPPILSQKVIDEPYLAKLIESKILEISQRMDEARRIENPQQRKSQMTLLQKKEENCKRLAYKRWPVLSVVLFDEIEKASDALFKILLGIIDRGELRMGNGVDITYFNNSLIIFTSNIGSRKISTKRIGFAPPKTKSHEEASGEIYDTVHNEMKKFFSPELRGRWQRDDAIIVFEPLTPDELSVIVDVQMTKIQNRFTADFPIVISFKAKNYILSRAKTTEYGARDIAGLMENKIFIPLCNMVASKEIMAGDEIRIKVDASGNNLVFERAPRGTVNFRTNSAKPKFFGLED